MIKSPKRLAYHLKISLAELIYIANHSASFYYEKKDIKRKSNGEAKQKNGKIQYRIINPSKGTLKLIQSRIKTILAKIELPGNIKGGVKGQDNIKNAKFHQGKKYHFCTDLSDFFPSITNKMVYDSLVEFGFSPDVSSLLTKLTTYKGHLPQGTPTSTHVANLAFHTVDKSLITVCKERGIYYTRYVDDLSFSSPEDFKGIVPAIIKIIEDSGFSISHRKTTYKGKPILVTGILVKNNSINAREDQLQRLSGNDISDESKKGLENYVKRVISS